MRRILSIVSEKRDRKLESERFTGNRRRRRRRMWRHFSIKNAPPDMPRLETSNNGFLSTSRSSRGG